MATTSVIGVISQVDDNKDKTLIYPVTEKEAILDYEEVSSDEMKEYLKALYPDEDEG